MIIFHITIALLSLIVASYAAFRPARNLINLTAGMAALVLTSGVYLVVGMHAHLISSCVSGIVYLSIVAALLYRAKRVLARQTIDDRR